MIPAALGQTGIRPPSLWRRLTRGFRKVRQSPDWETFVGEGWPDRIMVEEVTDRFHAKQGRTIARWTITHADGRQLVVYLKRHYELPRLHGVLAAIFPNRTWSPALQEWEHLEWAESIGIPVPRAVGCVEYVQPGRRLQSVLALEELTGMLALHEAIPLAESKLSPPDFIIWKQSLAKEMARLTRLLHDRRAFHKDLYLCHFYIREDDCGIIQTDWTNRVVVIDLHRLGRHWLKGMWWKAKDLGQLLYSSEIPCVTDDDRQVFWQAYTEGKRWPLLAWLIRFKQRLYHRHSRKRKSK